jgi:hypothetical protein
MHPVIQYISSNQKDVILCGTNLPCLMGECKCFCTMCSGIQTTTYLNVIAVEMIDGPTGKSVKTHEEPLTKITTRYDPPLNSMRYPVVLHNYRGRDALKEVLTVETDVLYMIPAEGKLRIMPVCQVDIPTIISQISARTTKVIQRSVPGQVLGGMSQSHLEAIIALEEQGFTVECSTSIRRAVLELSRSESDSTFEVCKTNGPSTGGDVASILKNILFDIAPYNGVIFGRGTQEVIRTLHSVETLNSFTQVWSKTRILSIGFMTETDRTAYMSSLKTPGGTLPRRLDIKEVPSNKKVVPVYEIDGKVRTRFLIITSWNGPSPQERIILQYTNSKIIAQPYNSKESIKHIIDDVIHDTVKASTLCTVDTNHLDSLLSICRDIAFSSNGPTVPFETRQSLIRTITLIESSRQPL